LPLEESKCFCLRREVIRIVVSTVRPTSPAISALVSGIPGPNFSARIRIALTTRFSADSWAGGPLIASTSRTHPLGMKFFEMDPPALYEPNNFRGGPFDKDCLPFAEILLERETRHLAYRFRRNQVKWRE